MPKPPPTRTSKIPVLSNIVKHGQNTPEKASTAPANIRKQDKKTDAVVSPAIPDQVLTNSKKLRDALVERVIWALIPYLEELVRETLQKVLNEQQGRQDTNKE